MPTGCQSKAEREQRKLAKAKRLEQEEHEKNMELIDISIGRLDGGSTDIQILAGATVRELILKYESNSTEISQKIRWRLEFGGKLLRKDQRIRDVNIVNGSHIIAACKNDDESDSDSSGPPELSMSFTWCVCALCSLRFPIPGHWEIWVKLDKVTGTILEDLSASWLSGYVGKLFPRWPGYSQKRAYADLCDDAICWAYVCPACASSRYWPYYLD